MSSDSDVIRILTVDDHRLIRRGIAGLVATQSDMRVVAEATNGREALKEFRAHRPDITLMDLQMPEMGGLDAIIAIRGEYPEARIIVLTTYSGDVQALRALKAGARAYLLKDALDVELLDTIRAVHAGRKSISPEVSFQLAEHATDDALTAGEVRVLAPHRRRQGEQGNCQAPLHQRGHGKGSGPKHPLQARREGPHSCRDDRAKARDHPALGSYPKGCPAASFWTCRRRSPFPYASLMRRLFSTFAHGAPGIGLLLLRLVTGIALDLSQGYLPLLRDAPFAPAAFRAC